jgi:hypothetical protein
MSSQIESGMSTYIGHFRQLIDVCIGFGGAYNPQAFNLRVQNLEYQISAVQSAVNLVDSLLPSYVTAESARREKFDRLFPLATRVQATAIVLQLPPAIITHIKEVVRKIRGKRSKQLKPEDITGTNDETIKHISVSQTSFNEEIEHFNQLLDLVASQPAYAPMEEDLSLPSLYALLSELRMTNDAVMAAITPLTTARQQRNESLFAPKTGMIDTALAVKEYVKAVFGAKSPEYKEVNHIKFKNRK